MKIVSVQQGSAEWHAHRLNHNNASEAPAMMGASEYTTREKLVRQKATGEQENITDFQQGLFDRGHNTEAMARPILEAELGKEFFPVVGVSDEHPKLAASYDGLDFDEEDSFEHKLWNEKLVAYIREHNDVPASHYWQLEQQLLVNPKLQRVHFVVSDGTTEKRLVHVYTRVPGRAEQLLAGWEQFDKDVAAYVPEVAKAEPVAAPVETLPTINYQLNGLSLTSNLPAFREAAQVLIERASGPLQTDQDFVDRMALCKTFGETEKKLDLLADQVLNEFRDVSLFTAGLRDIGAQLKAARLTGEKLVEAEKTNRRNEIKNAGVAEVQAHIADLTARLGGRVSMPSVTADFEKVMRGLKSLQSMKDKVAGEVARVKIESSSKVDAIVANLQVLDTEAATYLFLFNDLNSVIGKAKDDFTLLVRARVSEHKQKEAEQLEAQRKQIAEQERKKLEDEAAAKAAVAAAPAPVAEPPAATPAAIENTPVPAPTPARAAPAVHDTNVVPLPSPRKGVTDDEIIQVLSQHFNVSKMSVIERLRKMNLDVAEQRLNTNF